MKKNAVLLVLKMVYTSVCVLASAFYIYADFGKAITVLCGIGWLVLCILLCLSFTISTTFESLCETIISLAQIPVILNWLYWAGGYFYIKGYQGRIGAGGAIIHLVITILGAVLIYFNRKTSTN